MKEWNIIQKDITSSTNDDAIAYSEHAQGKKFVVLAEQQINGRGRRGHSWIGKKGNLFASLGIVYPLSQCGDLAFIISLAITQTILELSPQTDVTIKWPNDVLVRNDKISGILIEKGANDHLIIGVGVNIVSAPCLDNTTYKATSLKDINIFIECHDFLKKMINNFDRLLEENIQHGFAPIRNRWLKYAAGIGKEIKIMQEQTEKRGIYYGIDDKGWLLLQKDDKIEKISAGDVFIIKKEYKDK